MTIPVRQMLVSPNKYKIKCPFEMNPEYITIHNTFNDAPAENEVQYMINNSNQVSFHLAIDDKEVIQGIPFDRNSWNAGDGGSGDGNRKSISIEICYSKSGGPRYRKAENLTIQYVAQLLKERGWGINRVKKHQDWSGKNCPHRILEEGRWKAFISAIEKELKKPDLEFASSEEYPDKIKGLIQWVRENGISDGKNPYAPASLAYVWEVARNVVNKLNK